MDSGQVPATLYCGECGRPAPADELARFGDLLVCPACKNNYAQKLREGVAARTAFRYGGFWIRVVALLIDAIIVTLIGGIAQFAILGSNFTTLQQISPEADPQNFLRQFAGLFGLSYAVGTMISATYEALFVSKLGATPGKLALGLKVVRPDGRMLSLGRAFGRYFAKMLSWIILFIGYILVAFDSQKRGLHDLICDSRVIKIRDI